MSASKNFHIVCSSLELIKAINLYNTINVNNTTKNYSKLMLTADKNNLNICNLDINLYLEQNITINTISPGIIIVSLQHFIDVTKKINSLETDLEYSPEEKMLKIKSANFYCKIFIIQDNIKENIEINKYINPDISIKSLYLSKALEYTQISISDDEIKHNLNGIYITFCTDKTVDIVSTDGYRMSVVNIILEKPIISFISVIIPKKTCLLLLKVLKIKESHITKILIDKHQIQFYISNILIISEVMKGNFVSYKSLIPNNPNKLLVNRKLFYSAIDRVSSTNISQFRSIEILINDNVTIKTDNKIKGYASQIISYENKSINNLCIFEKYKLSIRVNPKYLCDVLRILNTDLVEIYFYDQYKPILIKNTKIITSFFVIMPLRI